MRVHPLTFAVAAHGLAGRAGSPPWDDLDDPTWRDLLRDVERHRLTGHLAQAVEDGALPVAGARRDEVTSIHTRALALDLLLERLLVDTATLLERERIRYRVLKGPAVAHLVYPDPSLRSFGDIDLLVEPGDYDSAIAALERAGARRRFAEPRHGFDRRFGKGVCLETATGLELDLHRSFVAGPFGLSLDTRSLFAADQPFAVGGRTLPALDPEAQFVHACYHASLGDPEPRPVALRDVAQMILYAPLELERVEAMSSQWRCGIVIRRAVALAWQRLGLGSEPDVVRWARALEPSTFERRAMRAYLGAERSYPRQAVAGLWAVHGVRAKVAYGRALLLPDRSYLAAREGGYLRRWRRGLRLLVRDRSQR